MVNVAGGSKGCHTCRKRRVKCDEAKPICHRCSRGKFKCMGYKRLVEWKHTTSKEFFRLAKNSPNQSSYINWALAKPGSPLTQPSLEAFKPEFCFARLFDNFVWASLGVGWLGDVAAGRAGALPLEALKALSQTNFGRLEHISEFKLKGATQYGQALRAMADAVGTNNSASDEELFLTVLVLILYSCYYPYRQWEAFMERKQGAEEEHEWGEILESDRIALKCHMRGILKLVYSCGPEAFQDARANAAFECLRMVLTISAVYNKKRLHLDEYHWCSVPWALNPSLKTEQSKLMDIFVVIPGFLEDYDKMLSTQLETSSDGSCAELDLTSVQEMRSALRHRIKTQLQRLFQWRWKWQNKYGSGVTLEAQAQVYTTGLESFRHRCLKFDHVMDSMVRAAEVTLYNAVLIWLMALLWKVELQDQNVRAAVADCLAKAKLALRTEGSGTAKGTVNIPYDSLSFEPLSPPGSSIGIHAAALEICRVYEWQSRHHQLGPRSTEPILLYIYPLGMAVSVLEDEDNLKKWITEMATSSPVTSGYRAGRCKMLGLSTFVTKAMLVPESRPQTLH